MPDPRVARRGRQVRTLALTGALALGGCMTWKPPTAPDAALSGRAVPRVRVVLRDGSRLVLERARVQGDSVVGEAFHGGVGAHTAVPLALVDRVEVASYSAARSAGLLAGLAAAAYAVFLVAFHLGTGDAY